VEVKVEEADDVDGRDGEAGRQGRRLAHGWLGGFSYCTILMTAIRSSQGAGGLRIIID